MGNFQEYQVSNHDIQAARVQTEDTTPFQREVSQRPEPQAQIISGNKMYQTTVGNGSSQHGVTTVHASDIESAKGGVLGTARSFMGGPTSNVKDHTQVTLPNGMETSAAAAATLGYLVKNPDGSYSNANKEPE